jgi:hypothetical protein
VAIDTFESEEVGTGARLTPLMEPPAWLRAQATRDDELHVELELAPEEEPPARARPSGLRRFTSISLFVLIGGGALVILGLAVLRATGHPAPW